MGKEKHSVHYVNRIAIMLLLLSVMLLINISFAITVPSGIQYYLPITFTNYQNVAVAANTPIAIGANVAGNLIGFNALAYQQYETCNLNNGEFFLSNGMVLNSWIEGNMLGELTANALCASDASTNALATSSNILYWVEIPTNTFLPANTGTATTNTLYLGWAGNAITSQNTLLTNSIGAGEAPQLSCGNPANTIIGCGSGSNSYGYYDNGANIFSFYDNFAGTSLSSNEVLQQNANGIYSVDNGVTFTTSTATAYVWLHSTATLTYPQTQDYLVLSSFNTNSIDATLRGGFSLTTTLTSNGNSEGSYNPDYYQPTPEGLRIVGETTGGTGFLVANILMSVPEDTVWTFSWPATGQQTAYLNYGNIYVLQGTNTLVAIANYYSYIGLAEQGSSTPNPDYKQVQWIRTREYVPNGIMPETTYGSVQSVYTPPTTPTLSSCPSSTKLDVGQTVSCTATLSGGTSPYTYNWLVSNSATNAITANMLFTGVASTNNTFTYTTVSADTSNSPEQFNVIVTDSVSNTVNSIYSSTFQINAAMTTPTAPTPTNPTIDSGQSITLSSSWTGGTSTYTIKWYTGPSGNTCTQDSANVLATYSSVSATSNSITVSPTSTNSYCIGVTDSATTPVTQLSSNDVVFVNTALGVASITASNTPTVNTGQYEAFTSSWSGGTPPYTANYLVFNTVTDALLANALYNGIAGTSNSFLWLVPTSDAGNTISANIFITDSASTPVIVNSIQLSTITVSSPSTTSTTTTTTTTATTTVASSGGGNSGGIIIHPPSTSVSSTSTSSTTSTSISTSTASTTSSASTISTSSTFQ